MTDALVDLSNVCHDNESNDVRWERYLAVKEAWRRAGGHRVQAIGDASIRYGLFGNDLARLEQAQRFGEVELVPFADPHLISRVLTTPGLALISNDQLEEHFAEFAELATFDRLYRHRWDDDGAVELVWAPIHAPKPAEASRHAEKLIVKRLGYQRASDYELLRWDWKCTSTGCNLAALPQLDALPYCDNGVAVCPSCDQVLHQLSYADEGIEFKLGVDGNTLERIALAEGSSVTLGRGSQDGHFDVSHLLEPEARNLISRSHLRVENRAGRLRISDPGSSNGTTVKHSLGEERALAPQTILFLDEGSVARLAGVLEVSRSGRRWPRGGLLLAARDGGRDVPDQTRLPGKT